MWFTLQAKGPAWPVAAAGRFRSLPFRHPDPTVQVFAFILLRFFHGLRMGRSMNAKDFSTTVKNIDPEDARAVLARTRAEEVMILDVRQPWEYEEYHLPGARLMPLPELADRLGELDKDVAFIVYCQAGVRSMAASRLLVGHGFGDVYNLVGGAMAWKGDISIGPREAGMSGITGLESPEEFLSMALGMELSLLDFYRDMAASSEGAVRETLERLMAMEEKHAAAITALYRNVTGGAMAEALDPGKAVNDAVEGGVGPRALAEAHGEVFTDLVASPRGVVQLAMMVEAQALDLYLRCSYLAESKEARRVLHTLAQEEKSHLKTLGRLMDTRPPAGARAA